MVISKLASLPKSRSQNQTLSPQLRIQALIFAHCMHQTSYHKQFSNQWSRDKWTHSPLFTKFSSHASFTAQWLTWTIGKLPYLAPLSLLGRGGARTWAGKLLCSSAKATVGRKDCTRWHWHGPYSFTAAGGFIQGTNYLIAANVPSIYSAANLQVGAWLIRRG